MPLTAPPMPARYAKRGYDLKYHGSMIIDQDTQHRADRPAEEPHRQVGKLARMMAPAEPAPETTMETLQISPQVRATLQALLAPLFAENGRLVDQLRELATEVGRLQEQVRQLEAHRVAYREGYDERAQARALRVLLTALYPET